MSSYKTKAKQELDKLDDTLVVDIAEIVGRNYRDFWESKSRYRVVKGGRGSKKSYTCAVNIIYNMMKYYHEHGVKPNTLVMRRFYNTHKDSTFPQLITAMNRMGVKHLWHITRNPMEMVYKPSGQKIIFKGADNPESITSITVEEGYLTWCWIEEAFQLESEEAFDKLDMSFRGKLPPELYIQFTLSMNPWSEKTWIKRRFWDRVSKDNRPIKGDNIFTTTRNYYHNEFLSKQDVELFERMKIENPRRYAIEGEGNWGISEGAIYTNYKVDDFNIEQLRSKTRGRFATMTSVYGLDFGFSADPTAFIHAIVDEENYKIYVCEELYMYGATNLDILYQIENLGYKNKLIYADSADPRTINELMMLGLTNITGVRKGRDSVLAGIKKLQDYEIIVHPQCINTSVEISNYVWAKDKQTDKITEKPIDDFNHSLDALRYACQDINRNNFIW